MDANGTNSIITKGDWLNNKSQAMVDRFLSSLTDKLDPKCARRHLATLQEILEKHLKHLPTSAKYLDFGCGPSIHAVVSASRYVDDITMADYNPVFREDVSKWLRKDPDAMDWERLFNYMASLENGHAQEIEDRVRRSVRRVIHCDVTKENMLAPQGLPSFDIITSSYCLEACVSDLKTFRNIIKKFYNMLSKGGYLVLFGSVESSWYELDGDRYQDFSITQEETGDAVSDAGFTSVQWTLYHYEGPREEYFTDSKADYCLFAKKP